MERREGFRLYRLMIDFWNPDSLPYVIDWSAWATFVVGVAAVIGAIVIGARQAGIAHRQADISDRQARIMEHQSEIAAQQTEIEQIRLRSELYDRRIAIYAVMEKYVSDGSINDGAVSNEVRDEYFSALSVARYLLGDDVEDIGKKIHTAVVMLRGNIARLDRLGDGDDEKRAIILEKLDANVETLAELSTLLQRSKERYLRLASVSAADPNIESHPA